MTDEKLAQPSPKNRAETVRICERVLKAVRSDEVIPLPINVMYSGMLDSSSEVFYSGDVHDLVARLAQEVVALQGERDEERELHAKLSADYHNATRKVCDSLAAQLAAMTVARDEARAKSEAFDVESARQFCGMTKLRDDAVAERDAYRSALCDLVAARRMAPEWTGADSLWSNARELLKLKNGHIPSKPTGGGE